MESPHYGQELVSSQEITDIERDFANDEKQATRLSLGLKLLNWTEDNIRTKIFEETDDYKILNSAYICPKMDATDKRPHITSYWVTTPEASIVLRLNARKNRVYEIVLSLEGVPTSERFEIESAKFQTFCSNLI